MKFKRDGWVIVALASNLFVICLAYLYYMNLNYPVVGSDYSFAVPSLLDASLFFRHNGLNIQWYTPSFGAGVPAFPNPNNAEFSLYTLLSIFFEPWIAIMLSAVIFIAVGFFSSYYLFQRVFNLNRKTSLLGAIFFSANGFMMVRMGIGHLGYFFFPVLPVLLIALLDDSIPILIASLLIACVLALAIHGAGYAVLVMFFMSVILILPLTYLYNSKIIRWPRLIVSVILGGLAGLLMSASKLSAIFSFMRFFPRLISDIVPSNPLQGLFSVIIQLLGTMSLLPLTLIAGKSPLILQNIVTNIGGLSIDGYSYGYWEFDMSLSPIIFCILTIALTKAIHSPRKYLGRLRIDYKWLALIALIFSITLCLELILAQGFLFEAARHLPMFGSLHVNQRFTAALIFPICLIATLCINKLLPQLSTKKGVWVLIALNLMTILPLGTYLLFIPDPIDRSYDITLSRSVFSEIRAGNILEVTDVGLSIDNTQAVATHTSNLRLYDPIFGYFLENFHPEVKPGSVWDVSGGYYNFTDPTGYVFPEVNGSRPFARIPTTEKDQLDAFVKRRIPDWNIPISQQILDWVSLISSIAAGLCFSGYLLQQLLKSLRISPPMDKLNR